MSNNHHEDVIEADFKREKAETGRCLANVVGLLSHDTSFTRRQLAAVLREQASIIETEAFTDSLNIFAGNSSSGENEER